MLQTHECCYAGPHQDPHDVKHPGDAVIDVILCPFLQFPATIIKTLSTVNASGTDSEPEGGNKKTTAALELQIETYATTPLHPFLITRPCSKLSSLLYTFAYLKDIRTASKIGRYDSKRGKTWSHKDTGDGSDGSTELLRSLPPGVTLDLGLQLSHLE